MKLATRRKQLPFHDVLEYLPVQNPLSGWGLGGRSPLRDRHIEPGLSSRARSSMSNKRHLFCASSAVNPQQWGVNPPSGWQSTVWCCANLRRSACLTRHNFNNIHHLQHADSVCNWQTGPRPAGVVVLVVVIVVVVDDVVGVLGIIPTSRNSKTGNFLSLYSLFFAQSTPLHCAIRPLSLFQGPTPFPRVWGGSLR